MCGILGSRKKGAVQIERRKGTVSNQRGAGPSTKNGNVVPSGRKGDGRGVIFIQWVHRHCPNKDRNEERGEGGGKEGIGGEGPDQQ